MYISIFTDELYMDIYEALPILKEWGMTHVDFRGMINGKTIENQTDEELYALKAALDKYGLKPGVIQSSLCKVHLPDAERQARELQKLEGVIRACNILGTRLVRGFFYWQHNQDDPACGELAMRPDCLAQVLELFAPVAKRAQEAGIIFTFENCGVTPDEVICVLEALKVPGWGMAWDVSNMFEYLPEARGDCVDYFTKALKYANSVHVKSRGISTLPELKYKKVPWDRVLAGVAVTGKDMPISVETHVPKESNLDKVETSKHVYEFIKRTIPAAAPGDMQSALAPNVRFVRPYADDPVRMVVVGLGVFHFGYDHSCNCIDFGKLLFGKDAVVAVQTTHIFTDLAGKPRAEIIQHRQRIHIDPFPAVGGFCFQAVNMRHIGSRQHQTGCFEGTGIIAAVIDTVAILQKADFQTVVEMLTRKRHRLDLPVISKQTNGRKTGGKIKMPVIQIISGF